MTGATIRLAHAEDFATFATITNHYIRTTAIHFGYDDVTADELRSTWREHQDTYPWLAAEREGEVVGYAKSGAWRTRSAYRWITETGIYLAPHHCGRGLGRPLYERLCRVLRAQGFHAALGGIALPNDASVRLHESLGFVHCGTVVRAGRKFDAWHDVGFWQLLLSDERHSAPSLATPAVAFAASH